MRDHQLPYRKLIGEVILSKGSGIRTVINKTETLGSENEFRVLDYEVLAGEDDLNTEVKECGSIFRFNYAKVFWNSKLQTEHDRLIGQFKPGEAVCDAMAGVGPFAVPAGRKSVFVWANDLNPDCVEALRHAIDLNKVRHSMLRHDSVIVEELMIDRSANSCKISTRTATLSSKLPLDGYWKANMLPKSRSRYQGPTRARQGKSRNLARFHSLGFSHTT